MRRDFGAGGKMKNLQHLPVTDFRELNHHPIGETFEEIHIRCEANKLIGNVRWRIW